MPLLQCLSLSLFTHVLYCSVDSTTTTPSVPNKVHSTTTAIQSLMESKRVACPLPGCTGNFRLNTGSAFMHLILQHHPRRSGAPWDHTCRSSTLGQTHLCAQSTALCVRAEAIQLVERLRSTEPDPPIQPPTSTAMSAPTPPGVTQATIFPL